MFNRNSIKYIHKHLNWQHNNDNGEYLNHGVIPLFRGENDVVIVTDESLITRFTRGFEISRVNDN